MNDEKAALLIIDMTNDFLYKEYNESLALVRAQKIIPKLRKLQEAFLEGGMPVIFASDRHLESDYELRKWGKHSMKNTKGSQIVDGLIKEDLLILERNWKPEDLLAIQKQKRPLFEVEKGSYSAFTDNGGVPTALDSLLKELDFKPGDKLFITGLHTNCCDKHTAADAWFRGYILVMVSDCTDAFDDPQGALGMDHLRALNYEKYWYDAEIKTSEEIIKEISH